jgi:hypothetical protein
MTKPPSTGPLTKKRTALRGSRSTKHLIPKGKPYIVGDDFWAALPDARRLLEEALKPKAVGRPRKFTMPGARS